MDSGFHLLDSRSFSVELGFRIRIVSGIPDSYTCIPDSKAQDSGFHKQKSPRFRIPNAKISRIPESGFLYMGRFFTLETIQLKIWAKSMLRSVKSPLPVDMRRSKTHLLKFPGDIACLTSPGWIETICICNQQKFERRKTSTKIIYSLI